MSQQVYLHTVTKEVEEVKRIPLTDWINIETPPQRTGWYDTKSPEGFEHGDRHYWEDGEFWRYGIYAGVLRVREAVKVSAYRGLTEKVE